MQNIFINFIKNFINKQQNTRLSKMNSGQILVAEDDNFSQMVVKMLISSLKKDAVIAADGDIAIRTFKEKQGNFSLVLLDLHMPKVDGFEAAQKIREAERAMGLYRIKMFGLSAGNESCRYNVLTYG